MTNIIRFPSNGKTIRETITVGAITNRIRDLIKIELEGMSHRSEKAWDVDFLNNMLIYRRKLSVKQQEHLMRLLDNPMIAEEYPNGLIL